MEQLLKLCVGWHIWRDERGQDFIEYALLAGFVGLMGAAIIPIVITPPISSLWSKVQSVLDPWD
jgi:Flp pilus assembly pilin Flp